MKNPKKRRDAVQVERSGDGSTLGVDLSGVQLPEGHIEADHWWAYHRDGAVSIVFDQVPRGGEVRLRIEARMSYEAFAGLVASIEGAVFKAAFQKYLDAHALMPGPTTPSPAADTKAVAHQVLRVAAIRFSHVGSEAEAALYSISPIEISDVMRSEGRKQARVMALVRIGATTRAMERLLENCRELAEELAPIMGAQQQGT